MQLAFAKSLIQRLDERKRDAERYEAYLEKKGIVCFECMDGCNFSDNIDDYCSECAAEHFGERACRDLARCERARDD
jgi:hypothetical protein